MSVIKENKPNVEEKQMAELEKLSKQLVDYLYKYGSPHTKIVITQRGAEHVEGVIGIPFELRD